jgi:hypothetical protein
MNEKPQDTCFDTTRENAVETVVAILTSSYVEHSVKSWFTATEIQRRCHLQLRHIRQILKELALAGGVNYLTTRGGVKIYQASPKLVYKNTADIKTVTDHPPVTEVIGYYNADGIWCIRKGIKE